MPGFEGNRWRSPSPSTAARMKSQNNQNYLKF
jgi:hypothetical protein